MKPVLDNLALVSVTLMLPAGSYHQVKMSDAWVSTVAPMAVTDLTNRCHTKREPREREYKKTDTVGVLGERENQRQKKWNQVKTQKEAGGK